MRELVQDLIRAHGQRKHPVRVHVHLIGKDEKAEYEYLKTAKLERTKHAVTDAKLLELGCANAEGDNLNCEYAEGR